MNKTEFLQLMQNPDALGAKQVSALRQVVSDFPYFTVSHVLLAKALFNEKHYEAEKYLKQTALVVPDREVFYNYLHNIKTEKKTVVVEHEFMHEKITVPGVIETGIAELIQTSAPDKTEPVPADEQISNLIEVEEQADHQIAEVETIENTVITSTAPGEPTEQTPEVEKPVIDNVGHEKEPEIAATVINKPVNEEHSFIEWLQLAANHEIKIPVSEQEKESQPEPIISEQKTPESIEPALQSVSNEVTKADIEKAIAKSNVNDFGGILDKFIKEKPSISRPKSEFFNPVNMAKQSVEEDEELVTETLASLYHKQGHLKKAIRAYEKLCLLYPSKMSYFATLIQKIKTEIKD